MTFKKILSFFLTGATALSMTTAAFASDDTVIMLPADVASQDWYAPAVRYVMEYDLMDVGHPENGAPVFEPSAHGFPSGGRGRDLPRRLPPEREIRR